MKTKQQIKQKIQLAELQIKRLNRNSNRNEICEDLYNSLILEKAVLKKELADLDKNPIIETIKNILPKKEKLICDYFKG